MGNRVIFLILTIILAIGCTNFKSEKIVLNYKDDFIKILSDDYVIDSVIVRNHIKDYYVVGLINKAEGSSIVYFKKANRDYHVYFDSLDYYCSKKPEVDSPEFGLFIRKKGYLQRENDDNNLQYISYNKIPCKSTIIDTIETINPRK